MPEETVKALLAKALRRQKELQMELEALQRLISDYQRLQILRDENPDADQLHLWHGASRRALKSEEVSAVLEETRRILLRAGRPMKRGDLVHELEARGYKIAGGDKKKVLGTNVWRSGKFDHIEGHGYWPKDVERPEGLNLM
jgi:hypothetical protein